MYIDSNDTIDAAIETGSPWYRTLNATQWKTLLASNLGWVFDGFEAFALILTVGLAMRQLLSPAASSPGGAKRNPGIARPTRRVINASRDILFRRLLKAPRVPLRSTRATAPLINL